MVATRTGLRNVIIRLAAGLLFLSLAGPASSHHGFAGLYEMDRFAILDVMVESVAWRNPHVVIHAVDGQGMRWELETGPVNLLARQGISTDTIHPGDAIKVRGNPGRNERPTMWLANVLLPDGTELMMAESKPFWKEEVVGDASIFAFEAEDAERADDRVTFFRTWSNLPYSRDKAEPVLTALGQQERAAYQPDPDRDACAGPGMPRTMFNPWPIEFIDRGDHILLRVEEFDAERTLWLQPPTGEPVPSNFGHSLATLDGDELRVETTHIDYPRHTISGDPEEGLPQSAASRVVETWRLEQEGLFMQYESTTYDPVYLAEPWTYRRTYNQMAGVEVLPWNCADVAAPKTD